MKEIIVLFLLVGLASSCMVKGWTNDFEKLSAPQKEKILKMETFQDLHKGFVYKINGQQLKEELKNHSKSIVYIFTSGCSSDLCKPISVYEDFALKNGYQLFLVLNGFANLVETLDQKISNPLFVIDNDYYHEERNYKYSRYFENELINKPLKEKNNIYMGNLYFFEEDSLVQILKELP